MHNMQIPEIRQRVVTTNLKKYGYVTNLIHPDHIEENKKINNERYGHDCYLLSEKYLNDIYVCEHCGKTQTKANHIQFHGDNCKHNPIKPKVSYACEYCGVVVSAKQAYETYHGDKCRCNKNGKNYKPYPILYCPHCYVTVTRPYWYDQHHGDNCKLKNINVPAIPSNLYKCEQCGEIYDNYEYFTLHHGINCTTIKKQYKPKKVLPLKFYQCEECGLQYTAKHSLKRHIREKHQ